MVNLHRCTDISQRIAMNAHQSRTDHFGLRFVLRCRRDAQSVAFDGSERRGKWADARPLVIEIVVVRSNV